MNSWEDWVKENDRIGRSMDRSVRVLGTLLVLCIIVLIVFVVLAIRSWL